MGEGGGVDQDEGGAVAACGLDPVDQGVLGIGLERLQCVPGLGCARGQAGVDVGQGRVAIDFRLATAEQVEVGAMQDQQFGHGGSGTGKGGSLREGADRVQFGEDHRVSIA